MATRMKTKAAARKANADKRPRAIARYIRISSRKAKIVLDLIRGKKAEEAQAILMYTPKSAAPVALKVLNSAIANAENNLQLNRDSLYVAELAAFPWPRRSDSEAHLPHHHRARPGQVSRRGK